MDRSGAIVVIGASLAGLRAVETLRKRGFDGRVVLVGAEPHLPYDRPPLSKEILKGVWEPERVALAGPERMQALGVDLRLGRLATRLEAPRRRVLLDDGESLPFSGVIVATGARPLRLRNLPDLDGIHDLRTIDDARSIARALGRSPRVVVVGAGFIGSEVAASCRERGLDVTVVESLASPLARAVPPEIGAACASLHGDHGVRLVCGTAVCGFEGSHRVEGVRLDDGRGLAADLVVLGIGVTPNTEFLAGSGVETGDGVLCDATLATNAPGVVAAGDVARWWNPFVGASMRVEHWTNAVEQGVHAANRLIDGEAAAAPFESVPFVWSDQYEVKIQFLGALRPDDTVRVVLGSIEERRFLALCERGDRLTGAVAFNRPRQLMACRRLLREGVTPGQAAARLRENA